MAILTESFEAFLAETLGFYSSLSESLLGTGCFFLEAAGDLALFLVGLGASELSSSSELSGITTFLDLAFKTGDFAFCKGDLATTFFFLITTSSDYYSDEDSIIGFFLYLMGDLAATFFFGFSSTELSSSLDSTFFAFFVALLLFFGFYYSELSSLDS